MFIVSTNRERDHCYPFIHCQGYLISNKIQHNWIQMQINHKIEIKLHPIDLWGYKTLSIFIYVKYFKPCSTWVMSLETLLHMHARLLVATTSTNFQHFLRVGIFFYIICFCRTGFILKKIISCDSDNESYNFVIIMFTWWRFVYLYSVYNMVFSFFFCLIIII